MLCFLFLAVLVLNIAQARNYHGAELRTHEFFQYGRFETRLKPAQGDGFLSSFFIYNDDYPSTPWAEIDFELLGRWGDNIDVNVIDEQGSHLRQHPVLGQNLHLDFHTYAFEWTPTYVAWFLDGEEFYRQTGAHILDLTEPGKLMMNIWNPVYSDWVGEWDDRILPRFARYDWASYAAYTPGNGTVGSNQDFTPVWLDEFDGLDSSRWARADGHTWNGNNADLFAENAVFMDGHLVLCLTSDTEGGFQDNQKPFALWARAHPGDSIVVRFSEELDPVPATSTTSYNLPGVAINEARLHADQRTVILDVSGLDPGSSYNLAVLGIRDLATSPNTQLGQILNVNMPATLDLPIHIDIGGGGLQGYLPDQVWSPQVEYGHEGGNYQLAGAFPTIEGTELDSVLASSLNRFSRYHVRLLPGVYNIVLHFVEHAYTQPGERSFQVYLEDSLYLSDLDVVAEVGAGQLYSLPVSNLPILDGSLDLIVSANQYGLGYGYSGPFLNALEVDGEALLTENRDQSPNQFKLDPIAPNPFNQSAGFRVHFEYADHVTLEILDILGRHVETLIDGEMPAGSHNLCWNAGRRASGVYFLRLRTTQGEQVQKIALLR